MGMLNDARNLTRARILVSGRVQGVAYRAFAQRAALQQGLRGGVRNLTDGAVEVQVEGDKGSIEALLQSLRVGPPAARVESLDVRWEQPVGEAPGFHIWY
jgi:acylphosphatase